MQPIKNELTTTYRTSAILAVVVLIASIVGIARAGDGFYSSYQASLAGLAGQDFVSLVGGLPVLVAAMWLAHRGSTRALLVWAGALFYFAYSYFFFVVGGFNAMFPIYILIVATSLYGLLSLLFTIDPSAAAARFDAHVPRRLVAGYLIGIALLFVFMWGGMSISMIAAGEKPDAVVHLVVAIDGAVLLPALLIGGWKLWHRSAWGYVLGGLLLVKAAMTGATLAFTTTLGGVWDGQIDGFNAFLLVLFGLMAVSAVGLSVVYFGRIHGAVGTVRPMPTAIAT